LADECRRVFRCGKNRAGSGISLRLHRHQQEAVEIAATGASYVLTTGTGSGKSLAYFVPIVVHALCCGSGRGIRAIVVYPMNARCNSQVEERSSFWLAFCTVSVSAQGCTPHPCALPGATFRRPSRADSRPRLGGCTTWITQLPFWLVRIDVDL
jgi:RAD3-like DEAD/DEAH box helicase